MPDVDFERSEGVETTLVPHFKLYPFRGYKGMKRYVDSILI